MPERKPDATCELPTLPQAALIYRLSGDRNSLHADPRVAWRAGFERPIMHGQGTFGTVVHALLRTVCDYRQARLRHVRARFSAPAFPGDTIRTELWHEGSDIRFRALALERGAVVLTNGMAEVIDQ
jgi:acyl dehydratase